MSNKSIDTKLISITHLVAVHRSSCRFLSLNWPNQTTAKATLSMCSVTAQTSPADRRTTVVLLPTRLPHGTTPCSCGSSSKRRPSSPNLKLFSLHSEKRRRQNVSKMHLLLSPWNLYLHFHCPQKTIIENKRDCLALRFVNWQFEIQENVRLLSTVNETNLELYTVKITNSVFIVQNETWLQIRIKQCTENYIAILL